MPTVTAEIFGDIAETLLAAQRAVRRALLFVVLALAAVVVATTIYIARN